MFEAPEDLDEWGFVVTNCTIANKVLSCQWGPLVDFYYTPSNVENGTQVGEYVLIGLPPGNGMSSTPFTIQVVPT